MRKVTIFILVLGMIAFLYSLVNQIYSSIQAGKRLDDAAEELVRLQNKNSELKKKLVEVLSLEFVEKQARNKLNLARPGETIVIISQKEIDRVLGLNQVAAESRLPNWQAWLKLFF